MDRDDWLVQYDASSLKLDDAQTQINERDRLAKAGLPGTQQIASKVRTILNTLGLAILQLEDSLNAAGRQFRITDIELARRQSLISKMKARKNDIQNMLVRGNEIQAATASRGIVLEHHSAPPRDASFNLAGKIEQQQQIMQDQDKGLDMLQNSIARQKEIGLRIGSEVDEQNELLESLSDGMDSTARSLNKETAHVVRVTEKAKRGGLLCLILLLIIAIIAVGAAPF